MRKFFWILFICLNGSYVHAQSVKLEFVDTIKLSGGLIVDKKKDIIFLKKDIIMAQIDKKIIRKYIRKAEFKFIDPFDIKSIIRRNKDTSIKFCTDSNRTKKMMTKEDLISGRYFFIPFKEELFVIININGRRFITFKCM